VKFLVNHLLLASCYILHFILKIIIIIIIIMKITINITTPTIEVMFSYIQNYTVS